MLSEPFKTTCTTPNTDQPERAQEIIQKVENESQSILAPRLSKELGATVVVSRVRTTSEPPPSPPPPPAPRAPPPQSPAPGALPTDDEGLPQPPEDASSPAVDSEAAAPPDGSGRPAARPRLPPPPPAPAAYPWLRPIWTPADLRDPQWVNAPRCLGEPRYGQSIVRDTVGRLWGWQGPPYRSCAFKTGSNEPLTSDDPRVGVTWEAAPFCTFPRDRDNSERDNWGRWWGWQGDNSCKFPIRDRRRRV